LQENEILESIPDDALENEDVKLASQNTEYRWRILELPNRENKIIEISYKNPDEDRLFMSHSGKWIKYDNTEQFEQYVIRKYYSYVPCIEE